GSSTQWLLFLRNCGLIVSPQQFTIDCGDAETGTSQNGFPGCNIQYRLFHVSQAWGRQLNQKIKPGSTAGDNRVTRGEIMTALKSIIYEENIDAFHRKIETFLHTYSE
ncbi:uncharacterized protein BYT42DRAFT_484227, partial [Radiomyces spectabilis]|uniref:uncharacterized protein n=1 Tax=Radiomyces spectabilis TaxID=64574 RepID=UPI00221F318F